MLVCFGQKVSTSFLERLWKMVTKFGWNEDKMNYLMACIAFESGGTFDPKIKNAAGSGAVGLIQFMPSTAVQLGVTVNQLAEMSAVEQLDYVEKYFEPYASRINTLSDMYMAILAPAYIGKAGTTPIYSGGASYRLNSALDLNSDGKITKEEATSFIENRFTLGLTDRYSVEWSPNTTKVIDKTPQELLVVIEATVAELKRVLGNAG